MKPDGAAKNWYKPLARDFACSNHSKEPPKALIKALSIHTGLSEIASSHILERLRHLTYCIRERETLTMYRLQPGTKQHVKPRDNVDE